MPDCAHGRLCFVLFSKQFGLFLLRVCTVILAATTAGEIYSLPLVPPEHNYRTITTDHFHIHYPERFHNHGVEAARLAERIHARLGPAYRSSDAKTSVVLVFDSDLVNAFATVYGLDLVVLYLQSPEPGSFSRFGLWFENLFVHEYVHILALRPYPGAANFLLRAVIGISPNVFTPPGFIEGYPVYEESQYGYGRLNDPLNDMIFRAALEEGEFPSLEEVMAGTHKFPFGRTVYLFGGRFVQSIRRQSPQVDSNMNRYYQSHWPSVFVSERLQEAGAASLEQEYESFLAFEKEKAAQFLAKTGKLTEHTALTSDGAYKEYLIFDGKSLYTFARPVADMPGIYRYELHQDGNTGIKSVSLKHSSPLVTGFTLQGENIISSSIDYYSNTSAPYQSLYQSGFFFDENVTDKRASYPVSAGRTIYYIQSEDPFRYLVKQDLSAVQEGKSNRKPKVLLKVPMEGILSSLAVTKGGERLAFLFRKEHSGPVSLMLCDVYDQIQCERVIETNANLSRPAFDQQNRLYFSSDLRGMYEIYRYDGEPGRALSVARTSTGLFSPAPAETGLYAIRYSAKGYDIVFIEKGNLDQQEVSFMEASVIPNPPGEFTFERLYTTDLSGHESEEYSSFFSMRPFFTGVLGSANYAGAGIAAFDPLQRHSFQAGLAASEDIAFFFADYSYNRFAHSVSASYLRSQFDKRDPLCNYSRQFNIILCSQDLFGIEQGSVSVSRTVPGRLIHQGYSLSVYHEKLRNTGSYSPAEYAYTDLNLAGPAVSYSISSYRTYFRSISPEDGFFLSAENRFYIPEWSTGFDRHYRDELRYSRTQLDAGIFIPWFFDNHVPFLGASGILTSGRNREIEQTRLSFLQRGIDAASADSGSGAVVFTAEYRFPLFWYSKRVLPFWPSFGVRYIALAPFYDYGTVFDKTMYRDNFERSYGIYADIGLYAFYLPFDLRITYAKGDGPSGESQVYFGFTFGLQNNSDFRTMHSMPGRAKPVRFQTQPFSHSQ